MMCALLQRVAWVALFNLAPATLAASPLTTLGEGAANIGLSSSLRVGYWRSSRDVDDRRDMAPATLWLKEDHSSEAGFDLHAEGWLQSDDLGHAARPEAELREFYFRGDIGSFDTRVGRQITAWGRADRINPTDNLTSRDLSRLFPDDDDLRRGSAMVRTAHTLGENAELQLYWVPEFRPEVHPLRDRIGPFLIHGDRRPRGAAQGAIKIDGSQHGVDWSVSYFDGYDPTGDLRASRNAARPFELVRTYPHQRTLGADMASVQWGVNLRAEAAYSDYPNRGRTDLSKRPFLFAVLGGDRNFGENVNLNLQYVLRRVTHHSPPERFTSPYLRGIALINAIEAGQRDNHQNGATMRLAWTRSDQLLRAEIFSIQDFSHHDGMLRALLRYEASDELRVTVGYEWNHGEYDTLFGSRRTNNSVFTELRWGY